MKKYYVTGKVGTANEKAWLTRGLLTSYYWWYASQSRAVFNTYIEASAAAASMQDEYISNVTVVCGETIKTVGLGTSIITSPKQMTDTFGEP